MRIGMMMALALAFASAAARAQAGRPAFSLVSGETVAPGGDMVSGKFGWPGIEVGYQHGLNEMVDVGAVFDLLYGIEGTTYTQFGISMGAPIRGTIVRRDKVSLQVQITPGFTVYTTSPAVFAFNFPIGGTLGIQVAPEVRIAVGADMVMKVVVAPGAGFEFAPLFGPAIEYYLEKNLAISLDTRFGPVIFAGSGATSSSFGFRTQVGIAYKLQ